MRTTAAALPTNTALTSPNGAPRLRRLEQRPEPEACALLDPLGRERLPECHSVEILTDTEPWLPWTAAFGPLSGFEPRLTSPRHRYVTTTCCSGGSLGLAHTARSIQALDRFQGADIPQRQITEQQLLDANVEGSHRSHRFRLPKR